MKEQIMEILLDLRPDVDFETETKLIDSHVLESFDIVSLVADLEEEFDVRIRPKDLVAENFNSADAIEKLIKKLQEDSLNA
jgi:acyl carrier protein